MVQTCLSLEGNALQLIHLLKRLLLWLQFECTPAVPKGRGQGKAEEASSYPPETWQWVIPRVSAIAKW